VDGNDKGADCLNSIGTVIPAEAGIYKYGFFYKKINQVKSFCGF